MATMEARSKKTLKQQAEIRDQQNRIEAKLDEALLKLDEILTAPAPNPAKGNPAAPAFESASALDLTATNKSLEGGGSPTPKRKGT